jgi:hypothetical protein
MKILYQCPAGVVHQARKKYSCNAFEVISDQDLTYKSQQAGTEAVVVNRQAACHWSSTGPYQAPADSLKPISRSVQP